MHTFWQRVNALGTYAGTVLAIMCIAVTITDYFHVANPTASIQYIGVDGLERTQKGFDRTFLVFDFKADLRSEFTWNTKQLFVYATVDFASPRNPLNQMVFWNTIIQRRENALISQPKLRSIYPFVITDQEGSLRGKEFNVTVAWQVMPRVGALYIGSETFSGFKMPEEYFNREKGKMRPVGAAAAA